ncbi:MAG TPA: hypothetical protein VFT22_27730 [Kofleriaceae bacterium]|nr:hypothetical protein [Kofleriaceae bacterium]
MTTKTKRVRDMTAAAQRFRRRVIAMLDARVQALEALWEPTAETSTAKRTTADIRNRIESMR